jgi:hypothetical protein
MPADVSAAAHLVDGVDLAAADAYLGHDGAGLWSGVAETIGVSTSPGRDGGSIDGGVFPPYVYSTMYAAHAATATAAWAAIRALRRRCKPGRTVTLSRVVPDPEGADANVTQTTTARRQADRPQWLEGNRRVNLDIDWLITEGLWYGDAVAIASAAGVQTIKGDLPTHRMTLTLAAGAARTVTNTTNGHWFTFGTTVPAGGVLIDVEARTATAITAGTDMSRYLSWGKTYPMRLNPGSNTLTVSAGTASISYQPAYE